MTELRKDKTAMENFKKFTPSVKKTYLRWLLSAKMTETRRKRVDLIVKNAKENKKQWT
jgi:uncharacterized protein YdeI (YjbR/CyaY-like superfamily)